MKRRSVPSRRGSLQHGEHTIDKAVPRFHEGDGVWVLRWSICIGGKILRRRTQGPTKGEVRARARRKAREMLGVSHSKVWMQTSSLADFIERVTVPLLNQKSLRPRTKEKYLAMTRLLVGECDQHRHRASLADHTIESGSRYRALESCLQEIAQLHGSQTALHARSVLNKYVMQQLFADELLVANPLHKMSMDLTSGAREWGKGRHGGVALSREVWNEVIEYLLTLDPADGVEAPRRGRWSIEDRIALRRNAIDLTLLQAATGLRVSEANALQWNRHTLVNAQGHMFMTVRPEMSKTNTGRTVAVLDERVKQRLLERRAAARGQGYVIGSPADNRVEWNFNNCRKNGTTPLYLEMAAELDIEEFLTERTHIWRATLNTLLIDVPEAVRVAHFGHHPDVNRMIYTDYRDPSPLLAVSERLRPAESSADLGQQSEHTGG